MSCPGVCQTQVKNSAVPRLLYVGQVWGNTCSGVLTQNVSVWFIPHSFGGTAVKARPDTTSCGANIYLKCIFRACLHINWLHQAKWLVQWLIRDRLDRLALHSLQNVSSTIWAEARLTSETLREITTLIFVMIEQDSYQTILTAYWFKFTCVTNTT